MDVKTLKRKRCEGNECNNNVTQTKFWVSDKLIDSRDPGKMKAVYEKTTKMMGEGIAKLSATGHGKSPEKLCHRYYLIGDGSIIMRDLKPDGVNPGLVPRIASCCRRPKLIIDKCVNCTFDLCEECGYSCVECCEFICHTCVTLFGNRPEEADRPLCEVCKMFAS